MDIIIRKTNLEMSKYAAECAAESLRDAIEKNGVARLLLATGDSQLLFLKALTEMDVKWDCVEMFHLDEYLALPQTHKASFRKYLMEQFIDVVHPKNAYLVDGTSQDLTATIAQLTQMLRKAPIDVALVGIGENGHIAFNDPPANFDADDAYMVVSLDERCKRQQVSEGWFATIDEVPKQAITMTVPQIMQSKKIITVVPGNRKSKAVAETLCAKEITPEVPATILKTHSDWVIYLDEESAADILPQLDCAAVS